MADARDVSGVWYGSWTSFSAMIGENRFFAVLDEVGGAVSGTTSEPHPEAEGALRATIEGQRHGARVDWIKRYDPASGVEDVIRYSGRINGEGTEIRGVWQQPYGSGGFTMQREKFAVEELEEEEGQVVIER